MKKFKRFANIATAVLMTACMSVPMAAIVSNATDPSYTITINSVDSAEHKYEAYQIFAGTLSGGVLTNITWGSGVTISNTGDFYTALKNANSAFAKNNAALTSASEVADVLSEAGDSTTDNAVAKAFAEFIAGYLNFTNKIAGTDSSTDNDSNDVDTITVSDGYYLIQESEQPTDTEKTTSAAMTRYILKVAGANLNVTSKASAPTVVKKVKENTDVSDYTYTYGSTPTTVTDNNYNDVADYNIGDAVPFKLYGTMPSTLDDYDHYYYKFTDTLGEEFTLADDVTYTIKIDGNAVDTSSTGKNQYNLHISSSTDASSNTVISIEIEDIKALKDENGNAITVNKASVITVEYSATLNSNANLGRPGQVNAVKLTYSNNPNVKYNPNTSSQNGQSSDTPENPGDNTGETPEDGVIVFTYGFDINKVKADTTDKLADAKFAIYTLDGSNRNYILIDNNGKVTTTTTAPTKDTDVGSANGVWKSDGTNVIEIKGLDAGTYYIEELDAPAGYNPLTEDVQVTITPTYLEDRQSWVYKSDGDTAETYALKSLEIKADNTVLSDTSVADGKGTVTIENKKGSTLPSTGGIGTTLFYVGGGAMVAVAGVFLITKKRMGKDE